MIGTIFLLIFIAIMEGFITVLPAGTPLPADVANSIALLSPMWSQWNHIVAIDVALVIVGLIITIEGVIFAFGLGDWVYKHIPFKFT